MTGRSESFSLDAAAAGRVLRAALQSGPEITQAAELPVIPGYSLSGRIGCGAAGAVYRGFRQGSDRPLAIKVLRRPTADGPDEKRAWRELDLLSSLRLPALPTLVDWGICEGRLYMASELIEGSAITNHAAAKGLGRRERVELMAAAAEAIAALHEHGVIHRDLKPEHIVVTDAGRIVILDLGLAHLLNGDPMQSLTYDGQVIGTPAYMAPEQARGERRNVGVRADVYALGAIGYCLLAGATPHEAGSSIAEAVHRVAHDPPRRPRELCADLPKALEAVLLKACDPDAAKRYGSATELAADLRRWVNGEPVLAGTPSVWAHGMRWVGRHPVVATVGLCVAIFMVSLGLTAAAVVKAQSEMQSEIQASFREPVAVQAARGNSEIQLVARAGTVLRSWSLEKVEGGAYAKPVVLNGVMATPQGGVPVAILHARNNALNWTSGALLSCYRLDQLDDETAFPLWSAACRAPEIQAPPGLFDPDDVFRTSDALIADVFKGDECPGEEIVAAHPHQRYGRTCIRVYRMLDGAVLYEAWHSGTIWSMCFLPDEQAGKIVCIAVSNPHGRDGVADFNSVYPTVLFAVRPRPKEFCGLVNLLLPGRDLPRPDIAWYRFLDGAEQVRSADGSEWDVRALGLLAKPGARSTTVAELDLQFAPLPTPGKPTVEGPRLILGISQDGTVLYRDRSDSWDRDLTGVAIPEQWKLVEAPAWKLHRLQQLDDARVEYRAWP